MVLDVVLPASKQPKLLKIMKNPFFFLFILICTSSIAQNESLFLSVGKPWFPDKDHNLGNFSVGINYQNRFSQSFAFDLNIEYVQSDDFPNFYNNANQLNEFLINQKFDDILANSFWSSVSNFNIGGSVSYLFVNNKKFNFSFYTGIGFMQSKSKSHSLSQWSYDLETGAILSYEITMI